MGFTKDAAAMLGETVEKFERRAKAGEARITDFYPDMVAYLCNGLEDLRETHGVKHGRAYSSMKNEMDKELEYAMFLMMAYLG